MKRVQTLTAAFAALVLSTGASLAGEFDGKWKVTDTAGKAYEITLTADGKATGTQEPGQAGTWQEVGESAVITWGSGWTTVIAKEGDKYTKSAFAEGKPLDGEPSSTGPAEKAK